MLYIRAEHPNDLNQIYALNTQAFESNSEAELVNRLRDEAQPFISLVAEDESRIVGHIAH